ncbi:dynein axonemal intermediate chain 4 [Bacillus rossius redtenbacheri]|uniref:dynein axonemal intermediate chain 4 n=1 Tax=Bacillus rossius redtenbacheri TaxID=93214 RepID=UPI002FDDF0F0
MTTTKSNIVFDTSPSGSMTLQVLDRASAELPAWAMTDPGSSTGASASSSSSTDASPESQLRRLASSRAFKVAAATLERLLACNAYRRQLEIFRGLSGAPEYGVGRRWSIEKRFQKGVPWQDHRAEAEEVHDHSLQHLWSWSPSEEGGEGQEEAGVTALCWNPADGDVLAAGYGRRLAPGGGGGAGSGGAVRCWNVKNPVHAERRFDLDSAVTALDFSKARPNLAVVCLLDGSLLLVDVSREKQAVRQAVRVSPEPLWGACWFSPDPARPCDEQVWASELVNLPSCPVLAQRGPVRQVLACGQDGGVLLCARLSRLEPWRLARLPRAQGPVRGLRRGRRRRAPPDIPASRHAAALVLARHPERPQVCYVGTDEGLVHRLLRLWLEAAACWEPLLTLSCGADPVQDAAWSPSCSTVLAAAAGGGLLVWELRRRTCSPVRRCPPRPLDPEEDPRVSPDCAALLFTGDGRNLAAGDSRGRVHVLALRGAAPAPLLPREALARVLRAALRSAPERLARLGHLL